MNQEVERRREQEIAEAVKQINRTLTDVAEQLARINLSLILLRHKLEDRL